MCLLNVTVHPFLTMLLMKLLLGVTVNLLNCAFGHRCVQSGLHRCSAGDPLIPLLFSLALGLCFDSTPLDKACLLSLPYYDDGAL